MTMIHEVQVGEAQLLDVRTEEEWDEVHAEHAIHIPLPKLLSGELDSLMPSKTIYVYCAVGGRADVATKYLQEHGFKAINVGGLDDWKRVCSQTRA